MLKITTLCCGKVCSSGKFAGISVFSGEFQGISSGLDTFKRDERTLVGCKQLSLLSLFNPYSVSVYYVYKGWYYTHLRSYV